MYTTPIAGYWKEHEARLHGYIAKRVSDSDAVDDILQDVYLKAHTSLDTIKSPGRLTAWLFRIAANAIVDRYRARKPWDELPEDLAAPAPERDVLAELGGCLQPLIADLPNEYRTALLLSEIEGVPQKDLAARLGLSLSGAKSRSSAGGRSCGSGCYAAATSARAVAASWITRCATRIAMPVASDARSLRLFARASVFRVTTHPASQPRTIGVTDEHIAQR